VYTGRVKSRVVVALVALAAVLLPGRMAAAEDPVAALSLIRPKPVKDAPDFQVRTPDDRQIRLADLRGKVVFLNFWATWCEPCREEMPTLDRLQARLGGDRFQVVALSVDQQGAAIARKFYEEFAIKALALYIDPTAKAAFVLDAPGLPVSLLVDRQGREIGRHLGALKWDAPEVVERLQRAMTAE